MNPPRRMPSYPPIRFTPALQMKLKYASLFGRMFLKPCGMFYYIEV